MVGARAWLVTLPLLVAASELGQWVLDRVAASTGESALFDHSPLGAGALTLLLAVAFVAAGAGLLLDVRRPASVTMPRRIFAVLPLCVFVVQEHMEYGIGHGSLPWAVGFHWSFVAGLLIQLPLVLGGYALARRAQSRDLVVHKLVEACALCRRARPLGDARFNRGPPLVVA
jgi:hypothetical protein